MKAPRLPQIAALLLASLAACSHAAPPAESAVQVAPLAEGLKQPWSIATLPDGSYLVSEKYEGVRRVSAQGKPGPRLTGLPVNVVTEGQSGFLDVALDPDFASNGFVYLAFLEGTEATNHLSVWKAKLEGDALIGGRVIFRVWKDKQAPMHPGGRLLFLADKTLLLSVGDGYSYREDAQDPKSHLGKILRIDRDGKPAPGNPFIAKAGYRPEIWSMGHRNIQGLTRDPVSGAVWASEHGPKGGDEINLIEPGKNYGWPRASHGINYEGTPVSPHKSLPDMEDPRKIWVPSIGASGLALTPQGDLLAGGLAHKVLVRLRFDAKTGQWSEVARLLTAQGKRIRDVRTQPDGSVLVLTDADDGEIWKVTLP